MSQWIRRDCLRLGVSPGACKGPGVWWVSKNVLRDLLGEEGVYRVEGFRGGCALGSQGCDVVWSPQQGI